MRYEFKEVTFSYLCKDCAVAMETQMSGVNMEPTGEASEENDPCDMCGTTKER